MLSSQLKLRMCEVKPKISGRTKDFRFHETVEIATGIRVSVVSARVTICDVIHRGGKVFLRWRTRLEI